MTLTFQLLHHHEAEVLVANVQHQAWSALVDPLWHICLHQQVVNLISVSGIMLIHKIKRIPLKVEVLINSLAFSERVESFIQKHVNV